MRVHAPDSRRFCRFRLLARAVGASVALGAAGVASATDSIHAFGEEQTINDVASGGPLIGYAVTDLMPSTDTIPYPVAGRLYEATLKVNAFGNWANPVIPRFIARTEKGQGYPAITNVFIPQASQGSAVPPNASSSGKLYFDVVGVDPNSVSYNDGMRDILAWVP